MLAARAGERKLDPYDLVWQNQDDEVMRRVKADPKSADIGSGGVFTAVCTLGKRDLMMWLLEAGIRLPAVLTACRTYVTENQRCSKSSSRSRGKRAISRTQASQATAASRV
jgi:hypothetical protein